MKNNNEELEVEIKKKHSLTILTRFEAYLDLLCLVKGLQDKK